MKTTGKIIKELRENRNWSQEQLAIAAKVKRSYVSAVERDRIEEMSAAKLRRIADALGIQPELLETGAGIALRSKVYDVSVARLQHAIREARKLPPKSQSYLADILDRMLEREREVVETERRIAEERSDYLTSYGAASQPGHRDQPPDNTPLDQAADELEREHDEQQPE